MLAQRAPGMVRHQCGRYKSTRPSGCSTDGRPVVISTNLDTQNLGIGRMTIRWTPEWGAIIIAVSPDTRRIAGIGDDNTIIFWDVESK